jgi:hypothetical protein
MARERPTRRPLLIRAWTSKEDEVLLEMLQKGKSLGSIGVRLKRPTSAIYRRKAMLQAGAEPKRFIEGVVSA